MIQFAAAYYDGGAFYLEWRDDHGQYMRFVQTRQPIPKLSRIA